MTTLYLYAVQQSTTYDNIRLVTPFLHAVTKKHTLASRDFSLYKFLHSMCTPVPVAEQVTVHQSFEWAAGSVPAAEGQQG